MLNHFSMVPVKASSIPTILDLHVMRVNKPACQSPTPSLTREKGSGRGQQHDQREKCEFLQLSQRRDVDP